jgi:ribosomal protein S18 acetylase RimI-like enzyme
MPPEEQATFEFGPPEPRVRSARTDDHFAISEAIGRAFFDDPVALYLFPNEISRRKRFGRFAQLAIDSFAGHGAVHTTDPIRGAAIWQAPSPSNVGFGMQLRLAMRLADTTRSAFFRAMTLGETMRKHHYPKPHWYLAILGTVPEAQGRGLGSAMMQPVLERCDRDGLPAYLESSKESNIPFYNRHGFELTGRIEIEKGPTLWPMVRQPA